MSNDHVEMPGFDRSDLKGMPVKNAPAVTRGRAVRLSTAVDAAPPAAKKNTKELLIEKAEQLFGLHGFDAVSFREIAIAAGQANSYAVQYYFKDKVGLIQAIFEHRIASMEPLRRELLNNLSTKKAMYERDLLKVLWLPIVAHRDAAGNHTYCRFLVQYSLQSAFANHPLRLMYSKSTASKQFVREIPLLVRCFELIKEFYPQYTWDVLGFRLSAVTKMFMVSVIEFDNQKQINKKKKQSEFDIEAMLDLAIAAINVPA